jgi:hypothetical protein
MNYPGGQSVTEALRLEPLCFGISSADVLPLEIMETQHADMTVTLEVGAVFPGTTSNEASMKEALAGLSRNDALLYCARVNAIVSGFGGAVSRLDRQRTALSSLSIPEEVAKIDAYVRREGMMAAPPAVFFRGQLLELARWVAADCVIHSEEPETFERKAVRSTFLRAALIASDLWSRRIFGGRLAETGDAERQLRRALGAFRKGTEEGNEAPHPGVALGRGWILFSKHVRTRLRDFDVLFTAQTGLTLEQYYTCAFGLMKGTFAENRDAVIFPTVGFGAQTKMSDEFDAFVRLKSQTPEELAAALSRPADFAGYKTLRERPILNFSSNRSAILDPTLYFDTVSISPLFAVLREAGKPRQNEIFGAFGMAFEDYAIDRLTRMYPTGEGLARRLVPHEKGETAAGTEFEIDALLNDVTSAVVFEMKASWIPEDKILTNDYETFLKHIREVYGVSSVPGEREKGVAQLAKSIGALARGEWRGESGEYTLVREIYPVLLVHDERMGTAGLGRFLDQEFRQALGVTPEKIHIHPLIVMTVGDLENLATSVEGFGLRDFLRDYSVANPERMRSVHNFMATSERYSGLIRPSQDLMDATFALGERIKAELFPQKTQDQ